jgi:multidrug efflux pump subunit AcrB
LFLSIAVVLVAGVSALRSLPRQEDPRIVNRNPLVVTEFPGASAQRVETLITEKIEDALQEIEEIKELESTSRSGVSVIAIELQAMIGADENGEVFSEIRDKLAQAERAFPAGATEPFFDDKRDPVAFTLIIGLTWTDPSPPRLGILKRLGEDLADRLRNIRGTELVRLYGDPEEQITVNVAADELADLGITAAAVAAQTSTADAKAPAGVFRGKDSNYSIEVEGELDSLARIDSIPLKSAGEQTVLKLGEIAAVRREWRDPPTEIALADGRRSVLVAARMGRGQRVDRWTREAKAAVDSLRENLGGGIRVETVFDQNRYTTSRLGELASNLVMGVGVVATVILMTMGWRASIVIGSAIPLTAALTTFGLVVVGGALHQMAIFGMIIALGLLIDNAIVVVDEVRKLRLAGHSPLEAVGGTVSHLFAPLLASTVTTMLAFAPIPLLPGGAGDFVGMIGGSVIMAIAASFAISMTIIVSLAALFGKFRKSTPTSRWWQNGLRTPRLERPVKQFLRWTLRRPGLALPLVCSPAILGFLLYPSLGRQFFPPVDRNMFHVQVWLPQDASIGRTRSRVEALESTIRSHPEIQRVDWLIGRSFPTVYYNLVMDMDNSPYYAQGVLTTQTASQVDRLVPVLQAELDTRFPEAQILVRSFGQGPPVQADVQYRIFGPDIETLRELGQTVRRKLQSHPDALHTMVTMPRGEPKVWLRADEDEAELAGFRLRDLADQLQGNLEGITGGSVLEQLEELPVRVRYENARRENFELIASTNFVRPRGGWTPLESLGELELRPALPSVFHFDGQRCNVVEGYTRQGALPIEVTFAVRDQLREEGFALPSGYRMELGGAYEQDQEAVGDLALYAPVLIVMIVSTMILSLRSVRMASLLLLEAIMCIGLAFLATWCYDLPFSFNTILGTLGLIGVGINDSIVVLAAIRSNPQALAGDHEAIVEEVFGCTRHIVSTSLTTSGGFLPLLLLIGGDFWPSLAIVLAGGVIGATLLSLFMIPAGYVGLLRLSRSVSQTLGFAAANG